MKFIITEEQSDKFNHKVKSMVNKFGIKNTLKLFDNNNDIIWKAYQDNPLSFLKQFNDLTPVEKKNEIYYIDKDGNPLFYFQNKKNVNVYINDEKIWMFFSKIMALRTSEIKTIINNWLKEIYGLVDLTPVESQEIHRARWKKIVV